MIIVINIFHASVNNICVYICAKTHVYGFFVSTDLNFIRRNLPDKTHISNLLLHNNTVIFPKQTGTYMLAHTPLHAYILYACKGVRATPLYLHLKNKNQSRSPQRALPPRELYRTSFLRACAWFWHQFLHSVWR